MSRSKRKKTVIALLKILLALGILGYLVAGLQSQAGFSRLVHQPKHWGMLIAAACLVTVAFSLSFFRWYLLVRALGIAFHKRDALRLGSLGYMLNFISPGSVGGDLFKAVFLAREHPGQRASAVASIVIDRVLGLYAMLMVASLGLIISGGSFEENRSFQTLAHVIQFAALAGTVGIGLLLLLPESTDRQLSQMAGRLPLVGQLLSRLIQSTLAYRYHRVALFAAIATGVTTHCLVITAFWAIERGLPVHAATFAENLLIVPASLFAGAVPATPSGLGTMEAAVELLYRTTGAAKGDGTMVALAYRVATVITAGVGAVYYLSARRKVAEMIQEADTFDQQSEPD
jgi:glycosyltransferase 2 family protein